MANKITDTQVYVLDQDEALDFYVGKLGFEVNTDADLGFMRWLTVNFPASATIGCCSRSPARRRTTRRRPNRYASW
jgi:catechol 2,3-dioxygenase-like lactoylglutathione lyase family enzyme